MNYVNPESKHSKTAYRALTISGISILSALLSVFFLPFILSPIAMILSHLSKGRLKTRHIAAQAATVIAVIALILNTAIVGVTLYKFNTDPVYKARLNVVFERMYGVTVDEYTETILNDLKLTLPVEE